MCQVQKRRRRQKEPCVLLVQARACMVRSPGHGIARIGSLFLLEAPPFGSAWQTLNPECQLDNLLQPSLKSVVPLAHNITIVFIGDSNDEHILDFLCMAYNARHGNTHWVAYVHSHQTVNYCILNSGLALVQLYAISVIEEEQRGYVKTLRNFLLMATTARPTLVGTATMGLTALSLDELKKCEGSLATSRTLSSAATRFGRSIALFCVSPTRDLFPAASWPTIQARCTLSGFCSCGVPYLSLGFAAQPTSSQQL